MIPIRDVNPSALRPWVNWGLIALTVYVFFSLQPQQPAALAEFAYRHAAIPCELTTGRPLSPAEIQGAPCHQAPAPPAIPDKRIILSPLNSMFLHAGLLHLLGNMWVLFIFGNNVEDAFGRLGYLVFYLLAGLVATGAFVAMRPESTIPLVGASGAVAGVMGAYFVLFPRAAVVTVVPLFFIPWVVAVSAWFYLLVWFVGQFFIAEVSPNVAWEAHVAGFLFGVLVSLLLGPILRRRIRAHRRAALYVR